MKVLKSVEMLHPILQSSVHKIQTEVIQAHSVPIRLFETGRTQERHQSLIEKGKSKDLLSMHLYNLENDPPLYATAVDYVYFFEGRWSWNLRDTTIKSWYELFGQLVLDTCPELKWGGMNRKSLNLNHFELRQDIIFDNIDQIPCTVK